MEEDEMVPATVAGDGLRSALVECLGAAEACLAHCIDRLGQGDTSMALCAKRVVVMRPVCEALATLLEHESEHVGALAAVCRRVCQDCAEACQPHAGHHQECAACLAACLRVVERTESVA